MAVMPAAWAVVLLLSQQPTRTVEELVRSAEAAEGTVSEGTRRQALLELARLGTPEATAAVLRALDKPQTVDAAAAAVGALPPASAVEVLPRCLALKQDKARAVCVGAAGRVGDAKCAAPLFTIVERATNAQEKGRAVTSLFMLANRLRDEGLARKALALEKVTANREMVRYNVHQLRDPALWKLGAELLSHTSGELRLEGCRALDRMHAPEGVDPLLHALTTEKEPNVRRCVVEALGDAPADRSAQVAKALAPLWKEDGLSETVLQALIKLRAADVGGPVMVEGLSSTDYRERQRSIRAVEKIAFPGAADALARLAKEDPEDSVRRLALSALATTATTVEHVAVIADALQQDKLQSSAREATRHFRQPAVAPHLFMLLKQRDPQVRRNVVHALGELGDPRAAVPLLDVVAQDETDFVVHAAAGEVYKVATADNIPRILKLLAQPQGDIVSGPLERAVITVDRAQGFKVILPLVQKHDKLGRRLALRMASDAHPSDEIVFQTMVVDRELDWRREAMYGLERLRSTSARDALCRALSTEKDPGIRNSATDGLAHFPDEVAVDCLLTVWKRTPKGSSPNLEEDIPRALRAISGQEFGNDLPSWEAWRAGGLGMGKGEEAMVAALQHQNAQVRILAARQLMKKGVARNVDTVANAALTALEQNRDRDTRVAMLELVGKMGRPRDVEPLVTLLSEKPSLEERVALARALDALGDGRGTLSFVEDLQSDKGATREEAVRALSDITGEPYRPNPAWWQEWWKTYAERYRRPPR